MLADLSRICNGQPPFAQYAWFQPQRAVHEQYLFSPFLVGRDASVPVQQLFDHYRFVADRCPPSIWHLEAAVARSAFPSLPAHLWQHLEAILEEYDPASEALIVRLFGQAMEVTYFEANDCMTTLGHGPIPIPPLPYPLAEDRLSGFQLPPDVTMRRQQTPDGPSYVFIHATLGELGGTVLKTLGDGQMALIDMVAGFADDPMTAERRRHLEPITQSLARFFRLGMGEADPGPDGGQRIPMPDPRVPFAPEPQPNGTVGTTIHECSRCGKDMVFLIFGDDPALALEDYARQLFPVIRSHNLITYVLGPPEDGEEVDIDERRSMLLEVWPKRKPARRMTGNAFDALLARLSAKHCPSPRGRR